MELMNVEKCMKEIRNDFSAKDEKTVTAICTLIEDGQHSGMVVHVKLEHSSLIKLILAGITKMYFHPESTTLYGEMIDASNAGDVMDLNPIILGQQENSPGSKFFRTLKENNPDFEYYLHDDANMYEYDFSINNLACSHYHPFTETGVPEFDAVIKAGSVSKLVGLMRRKISNSSFVKGFVNFRNGETPYVVINVPVMGGPLDKKYGKLRLDFVTLLTMFKYLAKPTYIVYNGLTHTFMCRDAELKNQPKLPEFYPLVKFMNLGTVNPSFVFDESLTLVCDNNYCFAHDADLLAAEIKYEAPVMTPKANKEKSKPAAKQKVNKNTSAGEVITPPASKNNSKSTVVTSADPQAFLNVLKSIIFNQNIPEDHAISIMRNLNW